MTTYEIEQWVDGKLNDRFYRDFTDDVSAYYWVGFYSDADLDVHYKIVDSFYQE